MRNLDHIIVKDAACETRKIKMGIRGASGSGKTVSSLKLAYGLCNDWRKIIVIDTEFSSGMALDQTGPFRNIELGSPYTPQKFIDCFEKAKLVGAEVIIFDSISHLWSGLGGFLDINKEIAKAKFFNNTFNAWVDTTNKHYKPFVDKIIMQNDVHVIFTMRTKSEYAITTDEKNKTNIKKVGTKEDMRDGFEYELSINFNIDEDHLVTPSKDRTGLFNDKFFVIKESHGQEILEWLNKNYRQVNENQQIDKPLINIIEEQPIAQTGKAAKQEKTQASANKQAATTIEEKENASHLLFINHFIPILSLYNQKLFERTLSVVQQNNPAEIKKAYEFLKTKENDLRELAEKEAVKWLKLIDSKKDTQEKIILRNEMPDIIKHSVKVQTYFASLIPKGENNK